MMITFAGSSHTRYAKYLLEQIVTIEKETSTTFRDAFLMNYLIKTKDTVSAHFLPGDLVQEHHIKVINDMLARKDAEYSSPFVQDIISPNASRIGDFMSDMTKAIGLKAKTGAHTESSTEVERGKLLRLFRTEQVHRFRPGRTYEVHAPSVQHTQWEMGMKKFRTDLFPKWQAETCRVRGVRARGSAPSCTANSPNLTQETEDDQEKKDDEDAGVDNTEEDSIIDTTGQMQSGDKPQDSSPANMDDVEALSDTEDDDSDSSTGEETDESDV
jgi:hypothetical protein